MISLAHPTLPSAAASVHASAASALELWEARKLRDALATLLRREQAAMADFLVALAEFDRRRGWEALGHASLFAFLRVELGLSTAATFWRMSAARLLQRFPAVIEPLRDGRLCLTTTAELAKVLTEENRAVVLPRFYGSSAREAKELVAELHPRPAPPLRALVTWAVAAASHPEPVPPLSPAASSGPLPPVASAGPLAPVTSARPMELRVDPQSHNAPRDTYPESLRAPEIEMTHPARVAARRDDVEPLTADLRRLHITVGRQLLKKLDAARDGLSHALPGATTEQVLEAALDLLLEKQAKARGLVKRPRALVAARAPAVAPVAAVTTDSPGGTIGWSEVDRSPDGNVRSSDTADCGLEPVHRRAGTREAIPAAVRRAVWERDGGRCTWPLDGGGTCGSTHRLQLDHLVPWARFGEPTEANLRLTCAAHNRLAARQAFGVRCVERYGGVPGDERGGDMLGGRSGRRAET